MTLLNKDPQTQEPLTSPQEQGELGYKVTGKEAEDNSEITFEDIVYKQHGVFRRMGYQISDRLRITDPLKRAQRYRDRVESKVDQMDRAIGNYLAEKKAIEKSITSLTKGSIESEKSLKDLEACVQKIQMDLAATEAEVEELSERQDDAGFHEYTEKKRELVEQNERYAARNADLAETRRAKDSEEREIKREQGRLEDYQAFVDELVKERAELERYVSVINDVIRDEENLKEIPVIKRIRGI